MQQQALVQEATSFTLSNSRVASIVRPSFNNMTRSLLWHHVRAAQLQCPVLPHGWEAAMLDGINKSRVTRNTRQLICAQGPPEELRALAPHIHELDLADNLLPSWSEAAQLAQELSELTGLDLSLNHMAWPPARPAPDAIAPFLRLETLVLNQCCLSWQEVRATASCGVCFTWPIWRSLHLLHAELIAPSSGPCQSRHSSWYRLGLASPQ